MINLDLYLPDERTEKFLCLLKSKRNIDSTPIKIYISSANPYNNGLQKIYRIYNNTELMEE
jgi:hypothetical protein